jgi:redox-sensing transcriptional repressor
MKKLEKIPPKTIERLAIYRRQLRELKSNRLSHIYSHQLAELANNTSAQVRRDLMIIGCSGGNPKQGYSIDYLLDSINSILDNDKGQQIAIVGVGDLGKAILSYSNYQRSSLSVVAAFDIDEQKIGKVIASCKCYPLTELKTKVEELGITLGIITVPSVYAQKVADKLIDAGVKGILNFAPTSLRVPENVFVERIDISMELEKVAYFAGNSVK